MTGEIPCVAAFLPLWLKEKLLAAVRGGIKTALIPLENQKDLPEIPDNIKDALEIIPVTYIDEVLMHALVDQPRPLAEGEETPSSVNIPEDDGGEVTAH